MPTKKKTVLVSDATSRQGGAVAHALLDRGHTVRALTRRGHSVAASQLARRGAEVVDGGSGNATSLERTMDNVDAVFATTIPIESGVGAELREGTALIDAASRAGVEHFVYSSIANAKTGVPHLEPKFHVESALRRSPLAWSIIAPAFLTENLRRKRVLRPLAHGRLELPLPPERTLAQLTLQNLAEFAALVIERPRTYSSMRIDLASTTISGLEAALVLSQVLGREVVYAEVALETLTVSEQAMYRWLDTVGYNVHIHSLHAMFPEVAWQTFDDWARAQNWGAGVLDRRSA